MKHFPNHDDRSVAVGKSFNDVAHPRPGGPWVASWTASAQPVWGSDFLFPTNVPAMLHEQTVRQIARISLGGERLRIVLSNVHGQSPIHIGHATVARSAELDPGAAHSAPDIRTITFGGESCASILPGASLVSDPVDMETESLSRLTVSLYVPGPAPLTTFHWDGRQTTWIVPGNQTHARDLDVAPPSMCTTARPLLTGIHVERENGPRARSVVVIGDSITDGATASLDQDTRWPDFLAARLAPHGVAVVNAGISGARLLSDGMGVNALARLERDVLSQPGVEAVIVMLGINDIAWPGTAFARLAALPSLASMTAGFRQLIAQLRGHGIRVLGATLLPFAGALPDSPLADYFQPEKDALRRRVNDWMRSSDAFDGIVDFDAALRDPDDSTRLIAAYDSGDHLHPGDSGLRAMGEAVDLGLLLPGRLSFPPPHPPLINPPARPTP
ncbi:SGNH/GDSL hydrolase family protein [Diaphorobacter aerolatus]|uniref:SGNH/GDSL hydrolase family protein n=1 Tax=Diaphorobacter aerolatus TaxID=1288495 RepID=A0A7H0GG41_9BURK|nr:SGNH/GDSL hydrolase family protein [Diaphorobacter aerolatus]QNP47257.1 SGNH/GDSL hydrolase family protein [Diaphorobacter aerolatus]